MTGCKQLSPASQLYFRLVMSFITFRGLSHSTPDGNHLFDRLDLSFGGERSGIVGRNGVGKSTLVRLASGDLPPLTGQVTRDGTVRVLRQELVVDQVRTVADAFGISVALARLHRALAGDGTADDAAEADWTLDERLAAALNGVGLGHVTPDRPLAALSGGQRTRVALAALVFDQPDMIVLDEPTNNLDAEGRAMVGDLLGRWKGGAIVVSHDRALLRRMDRIVELSSLGARIYGGNWDHYSGRKAEEQANAAAELSFAERQARLVEERIQLASERKARRDAAGSKARARGGQATILLDAKKERAQQSGGRGSLLAIKARSEATLALEKARENVERVEGIAIDLPGAALPAGRTVLSFDRVSMGYDPAAPLVSDLSFALVGPERVAVCGPNGSGKTTLLRLATGEMQPLSGLVTMHIRYAFLDQQVAMLDPEATLVTNFGRLNPGETDNACRAALARFGFRADAALRKAKELSGGEMLRAGLACVLGGGTPPGLLILDEPTNHLDLDSVAAVEAGLNQFDGALLVVSHDADFLDAIGIERRIMLG
jgi:ATPase subunit of ABC transporter with duplicated ATPase domains